MPPIILASASPRRRDLLAEAGIACDIIPSSADESDDPRLSAGELTEMNARLKAEPVARAHPRRVVVGADTLVHIDGVTLGKPRDLEEAEEMLARLVGRTHVVSTGVCVWRLRPERRVVFHETTRVTFRSLDAAGIRAYLAMIDPLDKAGAYAAQDHGEMIIAHTEGSWSNVVGLPMERLRAVLDDFPGGC